jgi:hypothetical protein
MKSCYYVFDNALDNRLPTVDQKLFGRRQFLFPADFQFADFPVILAQSTALLPLHRPVLIQPQNANCHSNFFGGKFKKF